MALGTASGLLFWKPGMPTAFVTLYLLTPAVSALVLWRFWHGSNWARWLVMSAALLIALPNGLYASSSTPPPFTTAFLGWRLVLAGEAVLGIALLVWLNTPSVRRYFVSRRNEVSNAG